MRRRALLMVGKKEIIEIDFYNAQFLIFDIATKTKGINIVTSEGTYSYLSNISPNKNYALGEVGSGINIDLLSVKSSETVKLIPISGAKDIHAINFITPLSINGNNYIIPDWYDWLNKFPMLNNLRFFLPRQTTTTNLPIITGNLIKIPKQLKYISYFRIYVNNINNFFTDFDDINPDNELKYFKIDLAVSQTPNVFGDLKNLPATLEYFKVVNFGAGSIIDYTGVGKVFNSTIDTFYFNRAIATAKLDQLLIDLANSVTNAIGDKIIYLRGTRSSASDSAVSYLEGLGFTVTITP